MKKSLFLTYICLIFSILTTAQNKRVKGKIIKDFGETFVVNNPDIKTDTTVDLKVILDVSKSSEDSTDDKRTMARFSLGISIPITDLPGITSTTRTLFIANERAKSCAMPETLLALVPGAG